MCDIYMHKCKVCDAEIEMHITDFCMPRDSIEVFCDKHVPINNVVIYRSLGTITLPVDIPENREIWREIERIREMPGEKDIGREIALLRQIKEEPLGIDELDRCLYNWRDGFGKWDRYWCQPPHS